MKITKEGYNLPYLVRKSDAFFPCIYWQEYPIFGTIFIKRKHKKMSEYGLIICGLWISIIHKWW